MAEIDPKNDRTVEATQDADPDESAWLDERLSECDELIHYLHDR